MNKGSLYLIPSLLGNGDATTSLPSDIPQHIKGINIFIVENIRSARRFIKKIHKEKDLDNTIFYAYGKHDTLNLEQEFLPHILNGDDVGLISEAGLPCIADPGAKIVDYAHQFNITVKPLIGPSSIFLALMASGMNGQNFTFHGYLPIDKKEREYRIKQMEGNSNKTNQTQIFMETPYRNQQLFDALIKSCRKKTKLCIASNLTLEDETIQTKTVEEWKYTKINIHKKPAVFLISS